MNRRSFMKFLPAGVLGAKQAAAEAAEKLALNGGSMSLMSHSAASMGVAAPASNSEWALRDLKRLVDPDWLSYRKQHIAVSALDSDLAMMKSIALGRRIDMQRDRNLQRDISRERSYLERVIAGFFD